MTYFCLYKRSNLYFMLLAQRQEYTYINSKSKKTMKFSNQKNKFGYFFSVSTLWFVDLRFLRFSPKKFFFPTEEQYSLFYFESHKERFLEEFFFLHFSLSLLRWYIFAVSEGSRWRLLVPCKRGLLPSPQTHPLKLIHNSEPVTPRAAPSL